MCLVAQLCPTLCDLMDCSPRAPLSMGISRQEYWSGLPFPPETRSLSSFPVSFPGTTTYRALTDQKCREPQCLFSPSSSNDQIFSALPSEYRIDQALLPPPVLLVPAVIIHRSHPRTTWPQRLGFFLSRPSSAWQPENESHSVASDSLRSQGLHGVLQARILEWVAVPFSRGSSKPRD